MSLELPLTSDSLPENLECIISNVRWQELIALLSVTVPDGSKINISNTTPAPADRIWPWIRLEADGRPDLVVGNQPYIYAGGYWLATHPSPVNAGMVYWGTEASVTTFNGGEAGAVTDTTGPFWEVVAEMEGKIPIGPGEIDAGPPAVNITENENKGAYDVQLTDSNYRHHRHWAVANQSTTNTTPPTSNDQICDQGQGTGGDDYILRGTGTAATIGRTSFVSGEDQSATNERFAILPQVRGTWFLRRTARIYVRQAA